MRGWTDGKTMGELRWEAWTWVDGRETVGNSLGRAPLDTMDGWETMGNDLGRGAGKRGK